MLPGISAPLFWPYACQRANVCGAVGCPDAQTHHQNPSSQPPPDVTSNTTPARKGPEYETAVAGPFVVGNSRYVPAGAVVVVVGVGVGVGVTVAVGVGVGVGVVTVAAKPIT